MAIVGYAQGKPQPANSKVDQEKVDKAIERGVEYLKKAFEKTSEFDNESFPHPHGGAMRYHELVTLTLLHAGLEEGDAVVDKMVKKLLDMKLDRTYHVALHAMVFQKLDPVKYQWRIAQCAQFLVDNQAQNGQWGYGEEVKLEKPPPAVVDTGKTSEKKPKSETGTKPTTKIPIAKRGKGPETGDNSNSQYGALGIRACADAGILFAQDVLKKAKEWWEKSQYKDGSWGYNYMGMLEQTTDPGYGSMTCGAVGAICIYEFLLGRAWKNNPKVASGVKWIADNFAIKENPKVSGNMVHSQMHWHYYYLYALERAGILYGTEKFDKHEWYPEGATWLIENQGGDGSWTSEKGNRSPITDTCFAILFLRRATKPLKIIETGK